MKNVKIPDETPILEKIDSGQQTKCVRDYHYLIVAGTTKAATTSLFAYLADHPAVCAATYKETRFFLSDAYPLPSKYRYKGDAEEYNLLFSGSDETQLRMESTPDYLYCEKARGRIVEFLPYAKLVFSLREPISRLISWYRFAKQIGKLPQTLNFDAYIELLFSSVDCHRENEEQHLQTLQQGCYTIYLERYFKQFDPACIHVLFYEELAAQPLNTMTELCNFADIDADFYSDYAFEVTNRSQKMRNSELHRKYRDFRFRLRQWTHNKPIVHIPLRTIRRTIEPLYLRLNTQTDEKTQMSEETRHRLINYYKPDVHALGELIGKPLPWETFVKSS
ncbi:MAG: sulfotransferase [Candidatus Poribacteria bacterium]|nr:sulfotransferase [Candidatus Poribacteria bacterium]